MGQRVLNLQPGGGLAGLGISPSSFCAFLPFPILQAH